ncbi:MAG: Lipid A biosynthesis lauroyltransferase [Myxococcota bacterium]|nr:Lipid A biosynthesis lauroyltransferase [Myxococcota bacterium]
MNRRIRKAVKNLLIYRALRIAAAVVRLAPRRLSLALGAALGCAAYLFARRTRRAALVRVRTALGVTPGEGGEILREMAVNTGRHLALLIHLRTGEPVSSFCQWRERDGELLREMIGRGRGVIVISAHLGNWELMARFIAAEGFPVSTIARASYDPRLTAWIADVRKDSGIETIWRDSPGAARAMLKALRGGRLLAFFIDQNTRVESIQTEFFDQPAWTPSGPARIALKTRAPVAAIFAHTAAVVHGAAIQQISVREIAFDGLADPDEGVRQLTQRATEAIEQQVRASPTDWMWAHDRWGPRR